jgi:hypothetical protein
MKKFLFLLLTPFALFGCENDAIVASRNLSEAADRFQIYRKIVFYNGITDSYIAEFEGYCSIEDQVTQVEVTCRNGENSYVKHFQGLSDNVTYTAIQLEPENVSSYHTRITLRPLTVIPEVRID